MHKVLKSQSSATIFKRRVMQFGETSSSNRELSPIIEKEEESFNQELANPAMPSTDDCCTVLVINSSHDMAKEITIQLQLNMPGCSIMYAPTLELAKWLLRRRKISLVVSSPILPDGNITKLNQVLEQIKNPPDVVVVGDMTVRNANIFGQSGYEFAAVRRLGRKSSGEDTSFGTAPASPTQAPMKQVIRSLGADLRNDLNNPLQEIVAMVFVAQAGGGTAPSTLQALDAIDKAAKNMAQLVNKLENRILEAVKPHSAER